jgi:hypothetical protein
MTKLANHIISKFRWQNTFDQKEKAAELQQRISSWSNTKMEKEIATIFDRICPATQTWSIQSMTLDLGMIDYDNLEEDLSTKLFNQLNNMLIEIILQAEKQGNNIALLHTDVSQISMLSHYFLTGTMPWNHKSTDSSVNKMMAWQFKKNKQNVIDMLQQVGATDENVRKRMAWQLDEPIVLKIIEGLETSNHNQIITFSEELTQIQQQQTLVPANKKDFKKNLWFWILNYLFTDRGTIFNKVAFMKSSIQQMSNHYNVSYSELLNMIELAIDLINVNSSTKADFILILNLLTKENQLHRAKKSLETATAPNYWLTLKQLFNSPSERKDSSKKAMFNELVIVLSKENKTKFSELFASFGNSTLFWTPVVIDLKNEALESVFHAVLPAKSAMLIESIYFIEKLCAEMSFKIKPNLLWEIGIHFLVSYKNAPFDNKMFLNYAINQLSKNNNELKENVLNQLTSVKIPSSSKTITTLEIYSNLTAILSDEISEKTTAFYIPNFNDLLAQLAQHIKANTTDGADAVLVQKQIVKHIHLNPIAALETLILFKDKSVLEQLLPYVLNKHHAELFVKRGNKSKTHLLVTLQKIITNINNTSGYLALSMPENLYVIGIKLMVLHPEFNSLRFLENLLEKILMLITPAQKPYFDLFITSILKHKKISNGSFASNDLLKIKAKLGFNKPELFLEKNKPTNATLPVQRFYEEKATNVTINTQSISEATLFDWIEHCLKNQTQKITHNNKIFKFKELFHFGLEISAKTLRTILVKTNITENRIRVLSSSGNWRNFSLWIANNSDAGLQEAVESLRLCYDFITYFMTTKNTIAIENAFWKQSWEIIQQNKSNALAIKTFISHWLNQIFKHENIDAYSILKAIQSNKININSVLKAVLMDYNASFSTLLNKTNTSIHEDFLECDKLGLIQELYLFLILEKKIPTWYKNSQSHTTIELFQELLEHYPTAFVALFKQNRLPQLQKQQIYEWVDFKKIIPIIQNFNKNKQQLLSILYRFHLALGQLLMQGITAKEAQNIVFKKVITAWTENNWIMVSTEKIWQELVWEICFKKNIPKKELFTAIEKIKYSFPPSLQIAFEQLSKPETAGSKNKEQDISPILKKQLMQKKVQTTVQGGIAIKNAGIVLLNNYIPMLMERLNLLDNNKFKDTTAQLEAVHYIQFVITGLTKTEESFLPLNKVLCGLPIETPVQEEITISETQKELIEGLINAAISHWSVIGDTSIQGFRGNWLVRDGLLTETEDRWELTVEKRVYDLLIHKSPFSFSIIKYPWMEKPLHVTWPY